VVDFDALGLVCVEAGVEEHRDGGGVLNQFEFFP
jgi:hypothetical protein